MCGGDGHDVYNCGKKHAMDAIAQQKGIASEWGACKYMCYYGMDKQAATSNVFQ